MYILHYITLFYLCLAEDSILAMAMIEHAAFVFDVLMNSFYPKHDAKLPLKAKSPRKFPLFVTYNKSRSFDGKTNDYGLRGCIGTFNSQYLEVDTCTLHTCTRVLGDMQ